MAKRKKKQEVVLTPEQQREADYQKAIRRMEGAEKMLQPEDRVHMYKEALRMFEELGDYEDSEVRKSAAKNAFLWHAGNTGRKCTRQGCG